MAEKNFVAFGDSNVNILAPLQNEHFKIYKFKGVSIKSILNKKDQFNDIVNALKKKKFDCAFFIFGVVDMNFYYYYKTYEQEEKNMMDKIYDYLPEYVSLVNNLSASNKCIIGILPSHIPTSNFKKMLEIYNTLSPKKYNTLSPEKIKNIDDSDITISIRNERVKKINSILSAECDKKNILFCDIYDQITQNDILNDIFYLKHNPHNIHQNYEYLLLVYLKKCLHFFKATAVSISDNPQRFFAFGPIRIFISSQ